MLHLILGAAGTGKTEYTLRCVADAAAVSEGTVLLVPEQSSFEYERAVLHSLGAAACSRVEVLTFSRLSQPVGLLAGGFAGVRADDGVRLINMNIALKKCASGLKAYRRAAATGNFAEGVIATVNELKLSGASAADLATAADKIGGTLGARLSDLAVIMAEYDSLIEGSFIDPTDDLTRLYEQIECCRFFEGKRVFIDDFKSFTGQQLRILELVIKQADEVHVALCADSLNSRGISDLFDNVKGTAARLISLARKQGVKVAEPTLLTENVRLHGLLAAAADRLCGGRSDGEAGDTEVCICAAKTAADEADFVARTIRKLVRSDGYRYRDFAVVYRNSAVYEHTVCDSLARYELPYFCDARTSAVDLALMKYVLLSLETARSLNTDKLIALSKLPLSNVTFEQACELDDYAMLWSVSGGKWLSDFTDNPDGFGAEPNDAKLAGINASRRALIAPLITLRTALESGNVSDMCAAVFGYLSKGAGDLLKAYARRLEASGDAAAADLQRASWDCLMGVLDSCVRAYGERKCDADEFISVLHGVISAQDIGTIPSRLDEVVVGAAERIRLSNKKVVFLVGAVYGEFPALPESSGLFSARDRKKLIDAGIDIDDGSVQLSVDERFVAYSCATAPSDKLFITYRAAASGDYEPSELVTKLDGLDGVKRVHEADCRADRLESDAAAAEWLFDHFSTDSVRSAAADCDADKILLDCDRLERAADFAANHLSPKTAARLFGKDIYLSPSKVEVYSKCPFSYFCKYGIKAQALRAADVNVMERGTAIHHVLEQMIKRYGYGLKDVEYDRMATEVDQIVKDYTAEYFGGDENRSARFKNTLQAICDTALLLVKYVAEQFRTGCFEPDGCEVHVGGDVPSIVIPLDDGKLHLNGYIDRVDVYRADGKTYLRVVDYKTGSKKFDLSDVLYGINMQMLLYLTALCDGSSDTVPAGVLYMPSKRPVLSGERDGDDGGLQDVFKLLKMNGVLLKDEQLLGKMATERSYYPFDFKKDGSFNAYSSVIDGDDFKVIGDYIKGKIADIGNRLHSGEVSTDPLDGTESGACKYCDYRVVCLRSEDSDNRKVPKMKWADVLSQMREGE